MRLIPLLCQPKQYRFVFVTSCEYRQYSQSAFRRINRLIAHITVAIVSMEMEYQSKRHWGWPGVHVNVIMRSEHFTTQNKILVRRKQWLKRTNTSFSVSTRAIPLGFCASVVEADNATPLGPRDSQ